MYCGIVVFSENGTLLFFLFFLSFFVFSFVADQVFSENRGLAFFLKKGRYLKWNKKSSKLSSLMQM